MPVYGSNIPRAREQLRKVIESLRSDGHDRYASWIEAIVGAHMHRAPQDKRTPPRFSSYSSAQLHEVIRLRRSTDLSQQEIANRVGLNPGRVSEMIHAHLVKPKT